MVIETLGEIRAKYNFWNEKERPYYEALSEAIRVLNAQNDNCHYAKIARCGECARCYTEGFAHERNICEKHPELGNVPDDWFCADGKREVKE